MKKKPFLFTQDCGPWKQDILVVIDVDAAGVLKFLKGIKARKSVIELVASEDYKSGAKLGPNTLGTFFYEGETRFSELRLQTFEDCWEYWEILIHELHHAVFFLSKERGMEKEMEAQAYLQEYLFHRIRRKLQGLDKI